MKLKNVYKLFILALLYVGLQSRSTGPAGTAGFQVTGAPGSGGSAGTCANNGCHTSGDFSPSLSISLLDGSDAVDEYEPGKAYTLKVSINASGSPARYGFQAVALDESDDQAGAWGTLGNGQQVETLSGRDYLEHSTPSQNSSFETEWIAPAIGTGEVTFYSAGIASNNNGGTTGDGTASDDLTIDEAPVNSTSNVNGDIASFDIFPNPVEDMLNLKINSRINGDFNIRVIDVMGRVASLSSISLQNGNQVKSIPAGNLTPGLYVVQLCGEDHLAAVQMLKK